MSYYGNTSSGQASHHHQQSGGGFNNFGQPQQQQQQQQQQPYGSNQQQQQSYGFANQQQSQQQGFAPMQQQPQQQLPQGAPSQSLWNPAAAASMAVAAANMAQGGAFSNTDAMIGLGTDAARKMFDIGGAKAIPFLESTMLRLRKYFAVDNHYVKRKIKRLLLPFISKHWKRQQKDPPPQQQQQHALLTEPVYELPVTDENAPDLYLPLMSIITYVLLCGLCYGTAGKFDPEVLPDVFFKCFITQLLEVAVIRFGFYMMQSPVAILDLFSYTGYKYTGLCLNMIVGLFMKTFDLGARGYYITLLWTASAASFFMLKTMANSISEVTSAAGPKRELMVWLFGGSQFATMWFVSQTKFL